MSFGREVIVVVASGDRHDMMKVEKEKEKKEKSNNQNKKNQARIIEDQRGGKKK